MHDRASLSRHGCCVCDHPRLSGLSLWGKLHAITTQPARLMGTRSCPAVVIPIMRSVTCMRLRPDPAGEPVTKHEGAEAN